MHGRLLFIGVAGFSLGVLLSSFVETPWAAIGFVALVGVIFLLFRFWKKESLYLFVSVLILAAALGMGRTMLQPRALPEGFAPLIGMPTTIEGKAVADPDVRETSQRLTVEIHEGNATTRVLVVASP